MARGIRPNEFPWLSDPLDDSNFEFYSQKDGVNRKIDGSYILAFAGPIFNSTPLGYTPTATGNSSDLNSFVIGSDGNLYFIDVEGNGLDFIGEIEGDLLIDNIPTNIPNTYVVYSDGSNLVGSSLLTYDGDLRLEDGRIEIKRDGVTLPTQGAINLAQSGNNLAVFKSTGSACKFRLINEPGGSIDGYWQLNESNSTMNFGFSNTGSQQVLFLLKVDGTGIDDKVGILEDAPTQNLDVNGTSRFRGHVWDSLNDSGTTNDVMTRGASGFEWTDPSLVGVQDFLDLIDTPGSYTGQSLELVRVNVGETGLEFVPVSDLEIEGLGTSLPAGRVPYSDGTNLTSEAALTYDDTKNIFEVNGFYRCTSYTPTGAPSSGKGFEMLYNALADQGQFICVDRDTSTYKNMGFVFNQLSYTIGPGTSIANITSTGISIGDHSAAFRLDVKAVAPDVAKFIDGTTNTPLYVVSQSTGAGILDDQIASGTRNGIMTSNNYAGINEAVEIWNKGFNRFTFLSTGAMTFLGHSSTPSSDWGAGAIGYNTTDERFEFNDGTNTRELLSRYIAAENVLGPSTSWSSGKTSFFTRVPDNLRTGEIVKVIVNAHTAGTGSSTLTLDKNSGTTTALTALGSGSTQSISSTSISVTAGDLIELIIGGSPSVWPTGLDILLFYQ